LLSFFSLLFLRGGKKRLASFFIPNCTVEQRIMNNEQGFTILEGEKTSSFIIPCSIFDIQE